MVVRLLSQTLRTVLWLSDIHIDPYYESNLVCTPLLTVLEPGLGISNCPAIRQRKTNIITHPCAQTIPWCKAPANATYGWPKCDTPFSLFYSALERAKKVLPEPDVVLVTGVLMAMGRYRAGILLQGGACLYIYIY
jgi:hypothetical protein